jgi:hypothetical protein
MTNRELIETLERMDPNADVLVVDPYHNYAAEPYGPYNDLTERMDNEEEFDVRINHVEGRTLVEIGSISHIL